MGPWFCQKVLKRLTGRRVPQLYKRTIQFAMWLSLSIVWGPLVPTLQPLILLACVANLLTFKIGVSWFQLSSKTEDADDSVEKVLLFLKHICTFGYIITLCLCIHMRLRCSIMLCALPLLAYMGFGLRSSASNTFSHEVELTEVRHEDITLQKPSEGPCISANTEEHLWHPANQL